MTKQFLQDIEQGVYKLLPKTKLKSLVSTVHCTEEFLKKCQEDPVLKMYIPSQEQVIHPLPKMCLLDLVCSIKPLLVRERNKHCTKRKLLSKEDRVANRNAIENFLGFLRN